MRIISKFRDYYDVIQGHGADSRLVMVREERLVTDKDAGYKQILNYYAPVLRERVESSYDRSDLRYYANYDRYYNPIKDWWRLQVGFKIVVFCGKPYPVFITERESKREAFKKDIRFIYDLQELNALVKEHEGNDLFERPSKWRARSWALEAYEHAMSKSWADVATEYKAPIMLVQSKHLLTIYPELKKIQFYKKMEPWQAYQELSMFMGNIASPDNTPVTVSDKDRAAQHGFDMKYGFRKRPPE